MELCVYRHRGHNFQATVLLKIICTEGKILTILNFGEGHDPGVPVGAKKPLIFGYFTKSGIAAMFFEIQPSYLKIILPVTFSRIMKNFEVIKVLMAPGEPKNRISS